MIVLHLARKSLAFSVGINRERNGGLAFLFLCPLENKAAFVLAGSIIHGAMRLIRSKKNAFDTSFSKSFMKESIQR